MDEAEARRRFCSAQVAVLSTVDATGAPHAVPVTFVVAENTVWSAVDGKPKRATALRRHENIRAQPRVTLLAQHWDADWSRLWWVRADGTAVLDDSEDTVRRVAGLLRAKYPQYHQVPVFGPVIEVRLLRWRGWAAADPTPG